MFIYDIQEVIDIHDDIIEESGGLSGIKDQGALESSLNNCFATCFGEELYDTVEKKISNVFYSLIKNHCFNDANKRTSVNCFVGMSDINNIVLDCKFQEIEDLALDVAEGKMKQDDILTWIGKHRMKNRNRE